MSSMKKFTIQELSMSKFQAIPPKPGIYWYEIDKPIEKPIFKNDNPAGHFIGNDPTVHPNVLMIKWVKEATILYIGRHKKNLRKRILQHFKFAAGKSVSAWGGRYLWQLDDSIQKKMTVRYKEVKNPKRAEKDELAKFEKTFKRLPFANLRR